MSQFFYIVLFMMSCSETATLAIEDAKTIPVDNSVDNSMDSGELEDTAG